MRERAGATSRRTISQVTPGVRKLPIRKNASSSTTASMAQKEIRDTSMLSRKEAMTLARKICPTDRGQ